MKYTDLIEKRSSLVAQLESVINEPKQEERKLSKLEDAEVLKLEAELESIDVQINEKRNIDNKINKELNKNQTMENKFSLLKAIEARANGRTLSEDQLAVIEAGKNEMRKSGLSYSGDIQLPLEYRAVIAATTDGAGQEFISEDKVGLIAPLRNRLVFTEAGATFLTGLVGDVSIPSYSGTSASWKGEVVIATDGAGGTDEVTLSPKRLTCFIDVSKQFLNQDSVNAEQMLMQDIVNSIADKLESTVFGTAAGSTTQPAGIFNLVSPTLSGTTSWANVVALETGIGASNVNFKTAKYVTSAKGRGLLKSAAKGSGGLYVLEGSEMNGYPVLVSNAVSDTVNTNQAGIVFGDFSQLLVGQWGAIDLVVDGLSQAIYGNVRIVINAYFDVKPRITGAFKTGSLN